MASATNAASAPAPSAGSVWELLTGLIGKDLKVKYQGSVLGFLWSLANPLVLLVVYTFVFQVVLGNGIPRFGYYLLSGCWSGTRSPGRSHGHRLGGRQRRAGEEGALPARRAAADGHRLQRRALRLQCRLLVAVMLVTGDTHFLGPHLLLVIAGHRWSALVFTSALSFLVAALNVRYRDTKHLVEIVLMAGFWVSPIVYSVILVRTKLEHHRWFYELYLLNPMTSVVMAMQRALYAENPRCCNGKTAFGPRRPRRHRFYLESARHRVRALLGAARARADRLPPDVGRLRRGALSVADIAVAVHGTSPSGSLTHAATGHQSQGAPGAPDRRRDARTEFWALRDVTVDVARRRVGRR